jgi:hypothetical protein
MFSDNTMFVENSAKVDWVITWLGVATAQVTKPGCVNGLYCKAGVLLTLPGESSVLGPGVELKIVFSGRL